MAFKDYYDILGIPSSATAEEIRAAYRKQSLRWHPDRNEGRDTTQQMQDVNEANTILKDTTKRQRYDKEYARFCESRSARPDHAPHRPGTWRQDEEPTGGEEYDYEVHDDALRQDIHEARKSAATYVSELMEALRRDTKVAADAAMGELKAYAIVFLILTVLGLIALQTMGGA